MLHALLEYAEQAGITAEAGFKPKAVRWLLQFAPDGRYLGLAAASEERRGRVFPKVPHLQFSGDTPMRQFLVDTAQHALLYGQDEPGEKQLTKHRYFLDRLRDAAEVEPVLGRIAQTLSDPDTLQKIHADLDARSPKAKPSDNVTFVEVTDDKDRIIAADTTWHDWWKAYWPGLFAKKGKARKKPARMRSVLTGEMIEPCPTHPKIKGLGDVGGNVETTLVGFNKDAFCSYGLKQSANAAVSVEAAETYAAALNELIEKQSRRLAGAKVVYWYTHRVPPEQDPMPILLDGETFGQGEVEDDEPEEAGETAAEIASATRKAGELLDAIRAGKLPELGQCRYCAIMLSGNAGRVVVRDWMEGPFEELVEHTKQWFDDLSITDRYGTGRAKAPKFLAILGGMVRELKDAPAPLEISTWRTALTAAPIPFEAMARALARVRIDVVQDNPANHARMGLLKAYLIRKGYKMSPELDEYCDHPAYLCGRVMAILAYTQWAALGEVGAGVVPRYYAAACATPALVLGRLVRNCQIGHLPKLKPGLRQWFDKQMAETWNKMKQAVPTTLTLEEQTLFAMGYYQQKANRNRKDAEQTEENDQ